MLRSRQLSPVDARPRSLSLPTFAMAASLLVSAAGCAEASATPPPETVAFQRSGPRVTVPDGSPLRRALQVGAVSRQEVRPHLSAPASVEADPSHLARIAPPLAGRIGKLHAKFGEEVKVGTPLFDLHAPDMAAAQTDLLRAQSALAQAERNLKRQKDLAEHGIAATREVEQAETDRDLGRTELNRASMKLQILGGGQAFRGGTVTVTSPIAGRVIDLACATGEFRNDSTAPIMTVADLSTVWVTANVQEKDIRFVHPGDDATASFVAYPDDVFQGRVLLIGDVLDPDTRTIKVRVAIKNSASNLKPGMFAAVSFQGLAASKIVAPTASLLLVEDKTYVFVEVAPWTFERRPVTLGEQRGDAAVLEKGIDEGSRILTAGAVFLQ